MWMFRKCSYNYNSKRVVHFFYDFQFFIAFLAQKSLVAAQYIWAHDSKALSGKLIIPSNHIILNKHLFFSI